MPKAENQLNMDMLVSQYSEPLYRLCRVHLGASHLAEDAVQETFIKAFEKQSSLKDSRRLKPWLFQIAVNTCRDQLKSGWMKRTTLGMEWDGESDSTTEGEMIRKEREQELIQAVHSLKEKYREVILLYYYEDFKTPEIADMLGITQETVRVRLARAKKQLQKKLGEVDFYE